MIVEFSVKNFRSIKELQTISFSRTGLKSSEKNQEVDINNIATAGGMELFKTIGVYGANASGKSNVIKALDVFIRTITREPSSQSNMSDLCAPFLYQKDAENTESFFQITIIIDDVKYRYGLTVKKNNNPKEENDSNYSKEIVTNEWLYGVKETNMTVLFKRTLNEIDNKFSNKDKIPTELPYKHTLFITHAAAFDNEGACKIIRNYLGRMTTSNLNFSHDKFRWMSIQYLENVKDPQKKIDFLKLLSVFNLNYSDVTLEKDNDSDKNDIFPQEKINLIKEYKDENNDVINIQLNLRNNESAGTQKLFDLSGLLLRAFTLPKPAFIILDAIDSNFHPALLINLVGLFNDPVINKSKSQLLFTSHDTNLMSPTIMRRDQFYFTEKTEDDSTRLYSLADLKGIRNDADFAKQYLAGYYGALPILKDYKLKNSTDNE